MRVAEIECLQMRNEVVAKMCNDAAFLIHSVFFSHLTLRTTGLYTKTLAKIIYRDITRFSVVFLVVLIGFCGAMFMALKATGSQELFT